jgi:hypothetical protein
MSARSVFGRHAFAQWLFLLFGRFPNAQRAVVSFAISLKTAIRVWDVSVRKTRTARMALVAALGSFTSSTMGPCARHRRWLP